MKLVYPFKTKGVLRFNPNRIGLKKKAKEFHLVLNIDDNIRHYYYNWLVRKYGIKANISELVYTTHVTVIKGNEFLKDFKQSLAYLESLNGQKMEIQYSPDIQEIHYTDTQTQRSRIFYTLPVYSETLATIRDNVVAEELNYPFHITIARKL